MKKYFMQIEGKSVGPFSSEELKILKVTPTTPIWTEGATEWKKASEFKELQSLFISSFQSYNKLQSNYSKPKSRSTNFANFTFDEADKPARKPKTGLVIVLVFAFAIAGGVAYVMKMENEKTEKMKEIENIFNAQSGTDSVVTDMMINGNDSAPLISTESDVPISSQDLVGVFKNDAGASITVSGNSDQHLTINIVYDFNLGNNCKGEISGDGKRVEDEKVLMTTFNGCEITLDYSDTGYIRVEESKKCKTMHGKNCSLDGIYLKE